MRIFVAGASGAIGQPLIAALISRGHEVTGMTHSEAGARSLAGMGAAVALVSAFDAAAVARWATSCLVTLPSSDSDGTRTESVGMMRREAFDGRDAAGYAGMYSVPIGL
jgi:uncharacterized protein YbjT (DUF2867 family)